MNTSEEEGTLKIILLFSVYSFLSLLSHERTVFICLSDVGLDICTIALANGILMDVMKTRFDMYVDDCTIEITLKRASSGHSFIWAPE